MSLCSILTHTQEKQTANTKFTNGNIYSARIFIHCINLVFLRRKKKKKHTFLSKLCVCVCVPRNLPDYNYILFQAIVCITTALHKIIQKMAFPFGFQPFFVCGLHLVWLQLFEGWYFISAQFRFHWFYQYNYYSTGYCAALNCISIQTYSCFPFSVAKFLSWLRLGVYAFPPPFSSALN